MITTAQLTPNRKCYQLSQPEIEYAPSHFRVAFILGFCQAQPKPQLSWAEWLYFQLIQPPPHPYPPGKVYFPALAQVKSMVEISRQLQHRIASY